MADNEIELIASIEADINGAQGYVDTIEGMGSGSLDAATAMLVLGEAIKKIQENSKKIDISKINQLSKLKFDNIVDKFNSYTDKHPFSKRQIDFLEQFGNFSNRSDESKAKELYKALGNRASTTDKKYKREQSVATLEEMLYTSRQLRNNLESDFTAQKKEVRTSDTRLKNDIKDQGKGIVRAFVAMQEQARQELIFAQDKELNNLKDQSRNKKITILNDYNSKKERLDSKYFTAREAQEKIRDAKIYKADFDKSFAEEKLRRQLVTSNGQKYSSIEDVKNRMKEIEENGEDFKNSLDLIRQYRTHARQLNSIARNLYHEPLKQLEKAHKKDGGRSHPEYIKLAKELEKRLEDIKNDAEDKIKKVKNGVSNSAVFSEYLQLEQLVNMFDEESKNINKQYRKEVSTARSDFERKVSPLETQYKKDISLAASKMKKKDAERVTTYNALINSKRKENADELRNFDAQQDVAKTTIQSMVSNKINEQIDELEKSSKALNAAFQTQIDIQNEDVRSTANVIKEKKGEIKLQEKLASTLRKARHGVGTSLRDAFRETFVREEDMFAYQRGLRGFAIRSAQKGWSGIAKGANKAFGWNVPTEVLSAKDAAGSLIAGTGVNPVTIAVAAGAATMKVIKEINKFDKIFTDAFKEIETLKTNLSVVYGSQLMADKTFSEISAYGIKSPFGIAQLTEMATLLRQSGVYSTELLDTLKMIGDTAGGNMTKMRSIATDYARIMAMGKANSRELRTFAAAGIPIYKILRDQEGYAQGELMSKARKGEISSEAIERAFKKMTEKGGIFYNAVNINAQTLAAKQQNLEDKKSLIKAEIERDSADHGIKALGLGLSNAWWNTVDLYNKDKDFKNMVNSLTVIPLFIDIAGNIKDLVNKSRENKFDKIYTNANKLGNNELTSEYESLYLDKYRKRREREYKDEKIEYENEINKRLKELEKEKNKLRKDVSVEELNKIEARINLLNKTIENIKPSYYYEQKGGLALQKTSDYFDKQKNKETSSSSMSFIEDSMFGKTSWGRLEEVKKEEKQLERMKEILGLQSRFAIGEYDSRIGGNLNGFGWIPSILDSTMDMRRINGVAQGRTKFSSVKEVADIFNTFYSGEVLDLNSDKISVDTMKNLFDNIQQIKHLKGAGLNISETDWDYYSLYTDKLGELYSKLNSSDSLKDSVKISKKIKEEIGAYEKWIEGIKDESLQTIFRAVLLDPNSQTIEKDKITAIEKQNHKTYSKLWERFAVKTLGISLDGLIEGKSVLSQFKENRDRTTCTALAVAMLKGNYNVKQAVTRNLVYGKNGLDINATRNNLEARSLDSRTSISISQAYLQTLQSSIDKMAEFLGGMAFTAEDAEKLYDPTMAHKLGYNSRTSFISAFNSAVEEGGEALEAFSTSLKGAISSTLEETKRRKENVEQIIKAKQTSAEMRNQVTSARSSALAYEVSQGVNFGVYNFNGKKAEDIDKGINFLLNSLGTEDKPATIEDVRAFVSRNYNNPGVRQYTTPEKTGLYALYDNVEDMLKGETDALNKRLNPGNLPWISRALLPMEQSLALTEQFKKEENEYKAQVERNKTEVDSAYTKAERNYQIQQAFLDIINGNIEVDKITNDLNIKKTFDNERVYDPLRKTYVSKLIDEYQGVSREAYFSNSHNFLKYLGASESNPSVYSIVNGKKNTRAEQVALNHIGQSNILMEDYIKGLGDVRQNEIVERYNEFRDRQFFKGKEISLEGLDGEDRIEALGKMLTYYEEGKQKAEALYNIEENLRQSIGSTLMDTAGHGFSEMMTTFGEAIRDSADASEKLTKNFKALMQTMSASIGDAMVQAGLQTIINSQGNKTMLAKGLALIAAGGGLNLVSGMIDTDDSDDDADKDYERLNKIKDDLKELLRQAREDSIYYEKTVMHRKALSTNSSLSGTKVNDAIISPNGNVITTSPRDYLIATTNPHSLAKGGTPNVNINFIDKSTGVVLKDQVASYDEKTNTLNLEAVIESKMTEFIASDKSDMAFALRDRRTNGVTYVG